MKNLLFVTSVIAVIFFPQSARQPVKRVVQENSAPTGNVTQGAKQDNESTETVAIRGILARITKIQQDYAEQVKTAEAQGNQNGDINRNIERYTLGLVIVGFIQALILAGTIWAVIHQSNTSKNSERAWIIVSIRHDTEMDDVIKKLLHVDTANLECVLLNCGRTPARLVRFAVRNLVSRDLGSEAEPNYGEYVQMDEMLLAPGGSEPVPVRIEENTLKRYDADQGDLYVYGVVYYIDAFNKQHFTKFCLVSPFLAGREAGMEIVFHRGGPAAYNHAT